VWKFVYDSPQTGLFNGAASYRIALKVPDGRNGLQPNLALSYNSGRLNGRNGDSSVERGPIGDSWVLEGGMSILRDRWYGCSSVSFAQSGGESFIRIQFGTGD
jgi:hypothetical protein